MARARGARPCSRAAEERGTFSYAVVMFFFFVVVAHQARAHLGRDERADGHTDAAEGEEAADRARVPAEATRAKKWQRLVVHDLAPSSH